jgi:DNA replication and repair protein RecF
MQLVHLSLTNFRNFIRLEMEFPPGATLVVGPNAQGKTSLLEAVDYLVAAESSRASNDRELVNFLALREPGGFARIVAEVRRADHPQRLEVRLVGDPGGNNGEIRLQKEILVNGVRRRSADLAGAWNAVLFQPDDLQVVEVCRPSAGDFSIDGRL